MDFFKAAKARFSYRGAFKDKPVPKGHLRKIVQAGLNAPSGCNFQTTEFVIVTEKEKIKQLAALAGRESAATAPAVIVAVCNMEPNIEGLHFWLEDCSAATENMLLAITSLGYASCWIDGALRSEGRAEKVAKLLGVPSSRAVRIVMPVGVPVKAGTQRKKKPFQKRAWFNRYGG
jgi:nitroreductase